MQDEVAVVDPRRTDLAENLTEGEVNLREKIQLEISDLRMQIEAEKRRHEARITHLRRECLAKLHSAEDLHLANNIPTYASIETAKSRQISKKKHVEMDSSSMYSKPQPSPISEVTTLVEPGDTSSPEGPVNSNPSDNELEFGTAMDCGQSHDGDLSISGGNKRKGPEALVKCLVTPLLREDFLRDSDSFKSKSLTKRKRLSGYLSMKKQRLAANSKLEIENQHVVDKSSVLESTSEIFNLASSSEELEGIEKPLCSADSDTMYQDHKPEDLEIINMNRESHPSCRSLRSRPPGIPAGRVFALQGKKVSCNDTIDQILLTDSDRPTSWPRSRRWRKSIGISVKALTDGFERLAMAKGVHSLAE